MTWQGSRGRLGTSCDVAGGRGHFGAGAVALDLAVAVVVVAVCAPEVSDGSEGCSVVERLRDLALATLMGG